MTAEPLSDLLGIAQAQSGMITTRQANLAGYDQRALVHLVRSGSLLHPGRGLYAAPHLVDLSAAGWHRHLCVGGLLLYPDAILTGASALLAHDLPSWGADLTKPRLLRPPDRSRGSAFLWVRPQRGDLAIATTLGPTVPVANAVVQHCLDSGLSAGVAAADAAVRLGHTTDEALGTAVARVAGWPRGSRARSMWAHHDARRESVAESRAGLILALHRIAVEPQVELYDRAGQFVARVDFRVRGRPVIIEVDGKVKYESGDPEVLWAEKRREDAIRALGYVVVRVTWADLEQPERLIAKVRAALAQAAA